MIGTYLKHYMKSNGIEQVFISEKTGICPQVLGAMLNEQRKMEVTLHHGKATGRRLLSPVL